MTQGYIIENSYRMLNRALNYNFNTIQISNILIYYI